MQTKISLIAAIDKKRGIGKKNQLLAYLPEDLQHFKQITINHAIIMGRKTYESIGKPLPNRLNIVLTTHPDFRVEGVLTAHSLAQALELVEENSENIYRDEIFIIGGGQLFEQTIGLAHKLYLTLIDANLHADIFFPDYSDFKNIINESPTKDYHGLKYKFIELER